MPRGNPQHEIVDFAVIGGGASGCAAAASLARAGASVTLLERHDLNTEASGRNAGSLHGQIQHEPFLELGEGWAEGWLPALRFLADSLLLWDGLSAQLDQDLEVRKRGGILVADDVEQLPAIERKVALENRAGIESRMLSADDLRSLAPWVDERAVGGALCPVEGKANPLLVAPAFARQALAHGARLLPHTTVSDIREERGTYRLRTSNGEVWARKVVVAGGDGTSALGRSLGIHLPISSAAVQVSVTERVEPLVKHLVYYAGGKLTFKQASSGALLIGGGWPARRSDSGEWVVDPDSLRANLAMAIRIAPAIADVKLLRTWVGIGNGTPDHSPIIGSVPVHPGVIIGFYPYMGFTAAPLMGRVLADLALGRDPGRDLAPFSPTRF